MKGGTAQREILQVILELIRSYLASLLSISQPRGAPKSDLYRVVTVAGLTAIADAVLRAPIQESMGGDISVVAQTLQMGDSEGLQFYLASTTGSGESLADYTARLLCDSPQLAVTRSLVVDWFEHRQRTAEAFTAEDPSAAAAGGGQGQPQQRRSGALFPFRNSVASATTVFNKQDGSVLFLRAVCEQAGWIIERQVGFQGQESQLESEVRWLLSSSDHALVDHERHVTRLARHAPEFSFLREIAFLFHLSLVPWDSGMRFAPVGGWQGKDLRMRWTMVPVSWIHELLYRS